MGYLLGESPVKAEQGPPPPQEEYAGEEEYEMPPFDGTIFTPGEVAKLPIGELRKELRSRGLNPAGGKEFLTDCLNEAVADQLKKRVAKPAPSTYPSAQGVGTEEAGAPSNNYARPDGQNVGNFLSERNSSRVLAPPGGASTFTFG